MKFISKNKDVGDLVKVMFQLKLMASSEIFLLNSALETGPNILLRMMT